MKDMAPRTPDWTDRQIDEFVEALAFVRAHLSARTAQARLGVSRQTMVSWGTRACAPSAANREAVLALAKALKKALP